MNCNDMFGSFIVFFSETIVEEHALVHTDNFSDRNIKNSSHG